MQGNKYAYNFSLKKNLKGRFHLRDQGADGKILLNWIFQTCEGVNWIQTGFC